MSSKDIEQELLLVKGNKELLKASDVVEWAKRRPESALHRCFQWDDTEAARQYRIWQARSLISLHIVTIEGDRKSISLSIDRREPGGGYRDIEDVARDPEKRAVMLADALAELRRVKAKYHSLTELARVFAEVDAVGKRQVKKRAA